MKTKTINLYKFEELSEDLKSKAIEQYRNEGVDTCWIYDEAYNSVKEFHEIFNTKECNREWTTVITSHIDDCILHLKGIRLRTYLLNNFYSTFFQPKYITSYQSNVKPMYHRLRKFKENKKGFWIKKYSFNIVESCCPFTGVCYDEDLLYPFRQFIKCPNNSTTFKDLINDAFDTLSKNLESESEYMHSDEAISETLILNDYYFNEDGKIDS
jgi:hypothetical protein